MKNKGFLSLFVGKNNAQSQNRETEKAKEQSLKTKYYLFNRFVIVKKTEDNNGTAEYFIRNTDAHEWKKDPSLYETYFREDFDGISEEIEYDDAKEQIPGFLKTGHLTKEETAGYPPSAPVADYYKTKGVPYYDKSKELNISYWGVTAFDFPEMLKYSPPHETFSDCMDESERDIFDVIWILCLLYRHGMVTQGNLGLSALVTDEMAYCFNVNGVPGLLLYDMCFEYFECFSVHRDYADKRETVAETIRDIIINEGRTVTYAEWEKINSK